MREQRLLGRIAEGRRQRAHRRRRRTLLAAGAFIAAGAAAVAVIGVRHAGQLAARAPAPATPHLTLADGSEATLTADGNVQIEEQTAERVRLRQRAGAARYVVRHDPAREFVVRADDVTVRVRGTIFSVALRANTVDVSVERGRVEIDDRLRTRDLVAGESLSVAGACAAEPSRGAAGAARRRAGAAPPHPRAARRPTCWRARTRRGRPASRTKRRARCRPF